MLFDVTCCGILQKYCKHSGCFCSSLGLCLRESYKFRQASDFWYLTGFEEPDSAVILEKNSSSRGYRMTLFSTGKDTHKEKWEGARTSMEDAILHFRADEAQSISSFPSTLKSIVSSYSNVYLDLPLSASMSKRSRGVSAKSLLKVFHTPPLILKLSHDDTASICPLVYSRIV